MMREYDRRNVVLLTGATESNLTHWTKTGLLRADIRETRGEGPGHHRRYSFRNLVEARIAVGLNRLGVPVFNIQAILDQLRYYTSGGREQVGVIRAVFEFEEKVRRGFSGIPKKHREEIRRQAAEGRTRVEANLPLWQLFLNPDTREQVADVLLTYDPEHDPGKALREALEAAGETKRARTLRIPPGSWSWIVFQRGAKEQQLVLSRGVTIVIAVARIIKDLEQATGDRWPTMG